MQCSVVALGIKILSWFSCPAVTAAPAAAATTAVAVAGSSAAAVYASVAAAAATAVAVAGSSAAAGSFDAGYGVCCNDGVTVVTPQVQNSGIVHDGRTNHGAQLTSRQCRQQMESTYW